MIESLRSQQQELQDINQEPQGGIMKKTLAALTILIITCTFSAGAFAAPQKQDKGLRQDSPWAGMNLTDKQQKQLSDLHQKFIDDTYKMRTDLMNLDQQIRMYMETSNPDPAKLKAMVMEKADLAKDLAVKHLEFALDARKISPELKYMPMGMGMGPRFDGHGMGYGPRGKFHGHHGFGRGAGFNGGPGLDCPRMMDDNQAPQDNTPSKK